jgi:hypothetical protein
MDIATGWHHSMALGKDGSIWVWGDNPYGQLGIGNYEDLLLPKRLVSLPKAKKIACGSWHSMMIDIGDNVWCWGRNENGMLGNNTEMNSALPVQLGLGSIKDIGAGCFQSIAIDKDDNIWVWGENWNGQLGIGNYNRQLTPVISIINFLNEFELNETHLANAHEETKTSLHLLVTPVRGDKSSAENAENVIDNEGEIQSANSKFNLFVRHNKKFLFSFVLNLILIWKYYHLRRSHLIET